MKIKIIATDLDGTLMAPDHMSITPRTMKALTDAHDAGVKLAISTGRALSLIGDVRKKLPFVDYIIYSNGAGVYDCKAQKNIDNELIPFKKAAQLAALFDRSGVVYHVYSRGEVYMKKSFADVYAADMAIPKDFRDFLKQNTVLCDDIVSQMQTGGAELLAAYFMNDSTRREILDLIKELGGLSHVSSIMDNIEIMSADAGKGHALDAICRQNGCTADNAMSFGDAQNDCSMLEYAAYSFAMANGDDACKKSAKFITASNAEDGVAQMIEKYALGM